MNEDYIEVYDFKKIGIVIGIIGIIVIIVMFFAGLFTSSFFNTDFPNPILDFPEFIPEINFPVGQGSTISTSYEKYLDFGLTKEDILFYQNYNCVQIQYKNGTGLQEGGKFGAIFIQKSIECGL